LIIGKSKPIGNDDRGEHLGNLDKKFFHFKEYFELSKSFSHFQI
jgi:isopentenyldiphosphate isomerase